jgi:hypothetical protein
MQKTIKPVALGGMAGGDKYVVSGILFKLARDTDIGRGRYLYGGPSPNVEYAAKAAGHDLKVCEAILPCCVRRFGGLPVIRRIGGWLYCHVGEVPANLLHALVLTHKKKATRVFSLYFPCFLPAQGCANYFSVAQAKGPPNKRFNGLHLHTQQAQGRQQGTQQGHQQGTPAQSTVGPHAAHHGDALPPGTHPGLHVPMQALVDYRGFRLIAMPLLPLGPDSIVYGGSPR